MKFSFQDTPSLQILNLVYPFSSFLETVWSHFNVPISACQRCFNVFLAFLCIVNYSVQTTELCYISGDRVLD